MLAQSPQPPNGISRFQLHIGGSWTSSGSGDVIEISSPATRRLIATVPDGDASDVANATAAAQAAWPGWRSLDPGDRGRLLRRLGDILREKIGELAVLESSVTGRPIREMRAQMGRIPEWLDYFSSIAVGLEAEANRVRGGYLTYTQYEPYGVCALLTPWNHPLLILVKKLAAALAAGNVVVVKPSELAPVSPLILASLCAEAGIPPGVVNVVTGGSRAGAALVADPLVARIDLTGGTATGRRVAAVAAERIVPCTLELGGKAPILVFEDTPVEEAVAGALFAAFVASGQTCVSGTRLLVADLIFDEFVRRFGERAAALRVGSPDDPATDVGPVVSAAARDRCLEHIAAARAAGARLVCGGDAPVLPADLAGGFFVTPTAFADVTPAMRLFREEVFGPVVAITRFSSESEAIALANDTEFALGAGVWTRDVMRAHRVAQAVKAGVVWVNDHHKNDPRSVWGGWDSSGYGKENGWDALRSYLKKRSVVVRTAATFDDWFAGGARYG